MIFFMQALHCSSVLRESEPKRFRKCRGACKCSVYAWVVHRERELHGILWGTVNRFSRLLRERLEFPGIGCSEGYLNW